MEIELSEKVYVLIEQAIQIALAGLNGSIPLVTFVLHPNADGIQIQHCISDNGEDAINLAKKWLRSQPEDPYVIACDGYLIDGQEKHDAIFLESFEPGMTHALLFGQRYIIPQDTKQALRFGNLTLMDYEVQHAYEVP